MSEPGSSQLAFDEGAAANLEAMYAARDVVRRRRLAREVLGATSGERVLDVGCGPGFFVAELLDDVGSSGSVVGVDSSGPMLSAAARRVAGHANVALREADATALPVDDESFDAALSVQVLEYVSDVAAALAELHRALRPGGRVLVWDVDWATASLHSSDELRMQRVLRAWDEHLSHPSLPRTLAARLRSAGFADVRMQAHAFATGALDPETYGGSIVPLVERFVAARLPEGEAAAWAAEQRELDARGAFFFSVTQFCFSAQRPS